MTEEKSLPVMEKNYKLVPPDGGWGYVICVAVTINFIAMTAFVASFGIIFKDFFIKLGMTSTNVSLLAGINAMSAAIAGFLAGPLLKTLSMRKLALLASATFNAGLLGTVFVTTKAQLFFCQGVLQNFGMGLLFNLSCTAINDYFKEKRLISLSVVNTVTAAAAIIAPTLVEWTTTKFELRGTLIMILAVGSMTFVGSSLFQPVAWHMKKIEIEEETPEIKLLLESFNNEKETVALATPVIKMTDPEKVDDLFTKGKEDDIETLKGNVVINFIKSFLDWTLVKEYLLTCACYGVPLCMFSDTIYTFFLPQYLYDRHWSNDSVAWAFSLQAIGDIVTRVVFIFSSTVFKILGSHLLYVIGLLVAISTKLALLWVTDHTAMLCIITIMGISRCSIIVLFPLVVSDSVRPQVFPSAMGVSMLIFGLSSIIMGPVTGAIRDASGDYATMFYVLIAFLVAVAVAMTAEVVAKRKGSKQDSEKIKNKD
ncbi:monocarboxylate transporter 13-like [Choristoneura fumiferana]|uniref:monocarboxylate transporter 13-like n=1 Tax=Choristoneura fumiferana TaxID=7141 RepID=UPI003D15B58B